MDILEKFDSSLHDKVYWRYVMNDCKDCVYIDTLSKRVTELEKVGSFLCSFLGGVKWKNHYVMKDMGN